MTATAVEESIYQFGRFRFSPLSGELTREGIRLPLQEKPLEILTLLLENPGEVVPRKAMVARLWPDGTHVDFDNNLNASVRKLREVLGDSADESLYVKTVPRRGYRFIAPVAVNHPQASLDGPKPFWRPWWAWVLVLVLAMGIFWFRSASMASPQKTMLAFLPMAVIGSQEELDYLGEGITEELITQCGGIDPEQLGVIAATSVRQYRDTEKTVAEIGSELGVDFLVEGAIQGEEDFWRITVQLIRVADQSHLWSKTYHRQRSRLLDTRREIGIDVTRQLLRELNVDMQKPPPLNDPRAYDLFLKARYHFKQNRPESFDQAVQFCRQVLVMEPGYGPAFTLLAEAQAMLALFSSDQEGNAYELAWEAAAKALEVNPNDGRALAVSGYVKMGNGWHWQEAGRYLLKAQAEAPGDAMVHSWAAAWLSAVARHGDAVEAAERARLLDPLSLNVHRDLAWYYYFAGRFQQALDQSARVLELEPKDGNLCGLLSLWALGRHGEALDLAERLFQMAPAIREEFQKSRDQGLEAAYDWLIHRLEGKEQGNGLYLLANRLAAAGRNQEALEVIARAVKQKEPWAPYVAVDHGFLPLFELASFQNMVAEMGLPVKFRDGRFQYQLEL